VAALDPFEIARAEAMLIGYDTRWPADDYEVLAVEARYTAPLVNPDTGATSRTWQRGGVLDLILRERAGLRIVFMEHKTSSEDIGPGSTYWRKLAMDGQVSGYFVGADALGFPAEACIYDVLGKPAQRPFKANQKRKVDETPEAFRARCLEAIAADPAAYYQRGEVFRLEAEMAEALFDDWQTAQMMRESQRLRRFPRNPDACFKWGRACEFFDVCTGVAALDDARRFRRSENVNPEIGASKGLPILSASRLRAARACSRLHQLQYLEGYRPVVDAETLQLGKLVHLGLETWWRAPAGERLEAALAALHSPTPAAQPELADASA
jgi:hypothetical protein